MACILHQSSNCTFQILFKSLYHHFISALLLAIYQIFHLPNKKRRHDMENYSTSIHRIFLPMSPLDISMYILRLLLPLSITAILLSKLMLDITSLGCTKLKILNFPKILFWYVILLKNLLCVCLLMTHSPHHSILNVREGNMFVLNLSFLGLSIIPATY